MNSILKKIIHIIYNAGDGIRILSCKTIDPPTSSTLGSNWLMENFVFQISNQWGVVFGHNNFPLSSFFFRMYQAAS